MRWRREKKNAKQRNSLFELNISVYSCQRATGVSPLGLHGRGDKKKVTLQHLFLMRIGDPLLIFLPSVICKAEVKNRTSLKEQDVSVALLVDI